MMKVTDKESEVLIVSESLCIFPYDLRYSPVSLIYINQHASTSCL